MTKLSDINKNNQYKIPENYFEDFTTELQTKISEENIKEKFGNDNHFAVPINYFETFNVKIKRERTIGNTIQLLKPFLAIAAGIILVFVIWQVVLTSMENSQPLTETNDSTNIEDNILLADIIDFSNIDSTVIENELDIYVEESDENTIVSLSDNEENEFSIDIDIETIYEYFIDYSDDMTEYAEVIAQL